jgi:hypothetical protein
MEQDRWQMRCNDSNDDGDDGDSKIVSQCSFGSIKIDEDRRKADPWSCD